MCRLHAAATGRPAQLCDPPQPLFSNVLTCWQQGGVALSLLQLCVSESKAVGDQLKRAVPSSLMPLLHSKAAHSLLLPSETVQQLHNTWVGCQHQLHA